MQKLRELILADPPTARIRDDLIRYLLALVDEAKTLSEEKLLGGDGSGIASMLCIALAWNYRSDEPQNVEGDDGWFTGASDPIFIEMLYPVSELDVDANDPESWKKLFAAADKLAASRE